MGKRFFSVILSLLLVLGCAGFVFAEGEDNINYVTDQAEILSSSDYRALESKAQKLSKQHNVGIYIVIVDDMSNWGYYNIEEFTQALFEDNDCGLGDGREGIMLCLSMADRDYDLDAHGNFANYAFTDYGKEKLAGVFLDDFRYDKWYDGFDDYLDQCDSMIKQAANGEPLDVPISKPMSSGQKTGVSTGVAGFFGAIVAFFRGLMLKGSMKSANEATNAAGYISGQVHFTGMENILVDRSVTTRIIQTSSGGGGGGGGTTINSAGHSHSSGKF